MITNQKNNSNQTAFIITSIIAITAIGFSIWTYLDNVELSDSSTKLMKESALYEKENDTLSLRVTESQQTVSKLNKQINTKTFELSRQNTRIDKLTADNTSLTEKYNHDASSLGNFKRLQRQLNKDMQNVQQQLSNARLELSKQQSKLNSANSLVSQQQNQIDRLSETIDTLERNIAQVSDEKQIAEKSVADEKWTNKILHNRLATSDQDLQQQKARIHEIETESSTIQHKLYETESQLAETSDQLQHKSKSLVEMTQGKDHLEHNLQSTLLLLDSSSTELSTKENLLEVVKTSLSKTRQTALQKEQEIKKRKQEIRLLESRLEQTGTKITNLHNRFTVFEMDSDILFNPGRTVLTRPGQKTLSDLAGIFRRYPDRQISIQGHTDDRPIGNKLKHLFPSNWELAAARAGSAIQFLQKEEGINPQRLILVSYSQYQPVASNETREGKASNRRIEIILMPKDFEFFRETTD